MFGKYNILFWMSKFPILDKCGIWCRISKVSIFGKCCIQNWIGVIYCLCLGNLTMFGKCNSLGLTSSQYLGNVVSSAGSTKAVYLVNAIGSVQELILLLPKLLFHITNKMN